MEIDGFPSHIIEEIKIHGKVRTHQDCQ
ncbi:hypothetical protein Gohar_015880, partial [Gossypium harknessii]|nr:hypothetical protein [Gossypium harknessii]MBA0791290.1 hypothetical protein [Gossypium harknessii]